MGLAASNRQAFIERWSSNLRRIACFNRGWCSCWRTRLPSYRLKYSNDQLVTGAFVLYAVSMFGVACLHNQLFTIMTMALCGVAWITVMSTTQTAAQMALPNWVRSQEQLQTLLVDGTTPKVTHFVGPNADQLL